MKAKLRLILCAAAIATLLMPHSIPAQRSAKRALTHNDYDSWRTIQSPRLSHDGKFLVYALVPEDGDAEVVARNLSSGSEFRQDVGTRPPQNNNVDDETGAAAAPAAPTVNVVVTADSRFAIFPIRPTKAEVEKARKEKKKPEEMPKDGLGIMRLADGDVTRIERVKSFQVPEEGVGYVAYLKEPATPQAATPAPNNASSRGPQQPKKEYGSDLVLRSLGGDGEREFSDVLDYAFARDAKSLVFTVSSKTEESNGVYAVTPGLPSNPVELLKGKGKYSRLSWDEKQTQLAFFSDRDDAAAKQPKVKVYRWPRGSAQAEELVSTETAGFKSGMVISERGAITFSTDGVKVFLGVAPTPEPAPDPDNQIADEDKVSVDLWNWKDDLIQPMQKVRANQDRNRSYRAVYDRVAKKYLQLADESMETISLTADGRWGMGNDDRPYRTLVGIEGGNYADVYLVNTGDNTRKPVVKKQTGGVSWSPNGKYALFYRDKDWYVASVPDGKTINLTSKLGVAFWREDFDSPTAVPSYGSAGWTKDDKYVLLYDHFDVWQVAADGSGAKNLTDGVGRKENLVFRYVRLEPPEPVGDRGIDSAKPLLLKVQNEMTRDEGFYRDRIDGGLPEKLLMAPKAFGNPTKAKDADVVLFNESTFNEFPDLLMTNSNFQNIKKVSDANPQKANLLWGSAELMPFKNADGVPLQATLMKPENFDPNKKYPMMVYIYEKLTQNVNSFVNPAPGTSINASYYVSNGYIVLMPDIVYTIGYPGQSALKCVLPAVQAAVDKGFVDEKAIGIQGHSWGGYEIAYMITQTNRFKAAAPGAPVVNMTSAYSGVRWETGLPRQFQYEHTQSRIGGSLWEYPMRFFENSALFQLDRVQTPIMYVHNDNDGAVPWYQGIELFLGLRRLGKEAYMFTYNGEPHGIRRRANQKDYTRRLQQFFDHFLKGAPKPDWMENGVPYLLKDKVNSVSGN
jgi:dipeptidyl aminopeptidase/acylaminoacyl peptidase